MASGAKRVAYCSFGADSTANVLLGMEHEEPPDEIVYCEVMFDQTTSGEIPEHYDFVHGTAIPFFEGQGIKVHVVRGGNLFRLLLQRDRAQRCARKPGKDLGVAALRQMLDTARL